MGSFQSSGQYGAYLQHCECAVFNVLASCVRSVLMFQRHSQARASGDGLAGLMEMQWGKGPALIMYVYSILPRSSVTHQGRGEEEGGSPEKDGDTVSGRQSVSPIVMQTC